MERREAEQAKSRNSFENYTNIFNLSERLWDRLDAASSVSDRGVGGTDPSWTVLMRKRSPATVPGLRVCGLLDVRWDLLGGVVRASRRDVVLEHIGSSFGPFGGLLGPLGGLLGASWGPLGASWGPLDGSWGPLGTPWGLLGALWALLGTT